MTIIISPFPIYFNEPSQFGLPQGLSGKESACNVGDPGSIPGQVDPLEKQMATVHGVTKSWT